MKFWLMLVLCTPNAQQCTVTWSKAVYPNATSCEKAAYAMLNWPEMFPHVEGAFCEMAEHAPKTYTIDKGELP